IGGIAVIGAFILILFRIIKVGLVSEDNFTKLLCLGTVIMFLTQFILNVGSNLGFLPVVGVSFPFFSYGGSNLLTNMVLVGIIQSAAARQK
ncbi:MAG: FtsW/RodA/SpoVE family cell cycle protein, partial [Patescibacteria group bacterium]